MSVPGHCGVCLKVYDTIRADLQDRSMLMISCVQALCKHSRQLYCFNAGCRPWACRLHSARMRVQAFTHTCTQVMREFGQRLQASFNLTGGSPSQPPTALTLDPAGLPEVVLSSTQAYFTVQAIRFLQPLSDLDSAARGGIFKAGQQYNRIAISSQATTLDKQPAAMKAILLSKCAITFVPACSPSLSGLRLLTSQLTHSIGSAGWLCLGAALLAWPPRPQGNHLLQSR